MLGADVDLLKEAGGFKDRRFLDLETVPDEIVENILPEHFKKFRNNPY